MIRRTSTIGLAMAVGMCMLALIGAGARGATPSQSRCKCLDGDCPEHQLFWKHLAKPVGRTDQSSACGTCLSCPPQNSFFGYYPTCWHRWPSGWQPCPVSEWEQRCDEILMQRHEEVDLPASVGMTLDKVHADVMQVLPASNATLVGHPQDQPPVQAAPATEKPALSTAKSQEPVSKSEQATFEAPAHDGVTALEASARVKRPMVQIQRVADRDEAPGVSRNLAQQPVSSPVPLSPAQAE